MDRNIKVDRLLGKAKLWPEELRALREILLETPLIEDVKWRQPCYTFQGGNIVILGEYKEAATLGFLKGALLKDSKKILVAPGQNTRSARMMKFTSVQEIEKKKSIILAYINEAIELEKSGAKVDFAKDREMDIPEELAQKFKEDPAFENAFNALTPGRRRAYIIHFSAPKQSPTRTARIEKWKTAIFEGKGMLDDYQKQRMKCKSK